MKRLEILKNEFFYPIDENGYLRNIGNVNAIDSNLSPLINAAIAAYESLLGDNLLAVYVRGSAACGRFIPFSSDLDTFAITKENVTKDEIKLFNTKSTLLKLAFPFVSKIDFEWITENELLNDTYLSLYQFIIKVQAFHLCGIDYGLQIAPFTISEKLITLSPNFKNRMDFFEKMMSEELSPSQVQFWCNWIMKTILRCGHEIVLLEEGRYTRDLFSCYKLFSKYYPEKQQEMYQVLELAVNPTSSREYLFQLIGKIGFWLSSEIEKLGHLNMKIQKPISEKYL